MADTNQNVSSPTDFSCKDVAAESGIDDLFSIFIEISILVAVSHFLHFFLKRVGQPSIISQMLAGLLVGRTCLGRLLSRKRFFKIDEEKHLISMASLGGTFFMFFLGIEMDLQFLRRSIRPASFMTLGTIITSTIIASVVGPIMYHSIGIDGGRVLYVFILIIILSSSASPMLLHMMAELNVTMSEVGRLGISTALINDLTCFTIIGVIILFPMPNEYDEGGNKFTQGLVAMISLTASIMVFKVIIQLINWISRKIRFFGEESLWFILFAVFMVTMFGYPSIIAAYVMGLAFPREGPAIRTTSKHLTFGLDLLILPIYFGYASLETDLFMLRNKTVFIMVTTTVILGTICKIVSTLLVAKYLKMQLEEGVVLGFLLKIKGHVELIIITLGRQYGIFNKEIFQALLISMLFDNMSAAPAASYFIRRERRRAKQTPIGLEFLNLDQELRVLFCVHSLYDVPTLLDLIQISTATNRMLLVPYLLHLVELTSPTPSTTAVLYNELEENVNDLEGGQNVRLLNKSVDLFYKMTGIRLRQLTVESSFADMHIDTCKRAMHVHAAMTVVPYHRKTKFDGNMGVPESRVMEFNLKLLERARCTIGIFVDRGIKCWSAQGEQVEVMGEKLMRRKVMVLFLGGADDREAVGCAIRLGNHPNVELTVVRFLMAATRTGGGGRGKALANDERSIVLMEREGARDPDEEFMKDVQNRFLSTRQIEYLEKTINNSQEMENEIRAMDGRYSLFIVGRRRREGLTSQLIFGITKPQDSEELGDIGNLLASSDFISTGSVLVVQQYRTAHDQSHIDLS